jgi:hypothetical protein
MNQALKQYLLLIGGFVGFAAAFAVGLYVGNDVGVVLLHASMSCIVSGMLFKWMAGLILESLWTRRQALKKAALAAINAGVPVKGNAAKGGAQ